MIGPREDAPRGRPATRTPGRCPRSPSRATQGELYGPPRSRLRPAPPHHCWRDLPARGRPARSSLGSGPGHPVLGGLLEGARSSAALDDLPPRGRERDESRHGGRPRGHRARSSKIPRARGTLSCLSALFDVARSAIPNPQPPWSLAGPLGRLERVWASSPLAWPVTARTSAKVVARDVRCAPGRLEPSRPRARRRGWAPTTSSGTTSAPRRQRGPAAERRIFPGRRGRAPNEGVAARPSRRSRHDW